MQITTAPAAESRDTFKPFSLTFHLATLEEAGQLFTLFNEYALNEFTSAIDANAVRTAMKRAGGDCVYRYSDFDRLKAILNKFYK